MKKIRSISCRLIMIMALYACMQLPFTLAHAAVSARDGGTQAMPLISLISELEGKFDVRFNYNTHLLEGKTITLKNSTTFKAGNIETVMNHYISPLGLVCKKIGEKFFVVKSENATGSEMKIAAVSPLPVVQQGVKGTVKDSAGHVLPGVTVRLKGASRAAVSDKDGNFSMENVNDGDVLIFSLIGYGPVEYTISGQQFFQVVMRELSTALDQVVVTALGVKRAEKALGYAVQRVKGSAVQTVKGVDMATSLTGQVAGLVIKNSTEFNAKPTIELRGEGALLVIDGVPYGNMTLRDVPSDDIESIDVLKGPTASALYGSRASGGVILITTKKGSGEGLAVNINSNTMVQSGFLSLPKVQSSYARGQNGKIDNDYVWGPKLDAGNTARDWNPETKQFENNRPLNSVGKNNLKNFMQMGLITNNNINVSQSGKYGSFRASLNHIFNKGQFPNTKLNMFNFTLGGELKASDKFTLEGHMGVSRRTAPQIWGTGYGNQGYIYQLTMWTGPEYDIRQYRDYWKTPNQTQNWMYTNWYDNPYLIAYEKLNGIQESTVNASLTANYKFTSDLSLLIRLGYDVYNNKETKRNPTANIYSTRGGWNARGLYSISDAFGWSTNNDVMLSYNKKVRDWSFDAMAGATLYYYVDESLYASTKNGLTSPTFYSIYASVDPAIVQPGYSSRQVNSLYGRAAIGWKNAVFLDVTGRNDWNSAQSKKQRDYFYPSVGTSVVMSEFMKMPAFVDMWKLRGSWATFKTPAGVYTLNRLYNTTASAWNTLNSASYPRTMLGSPDILPSSMRTWEVGTAAYLFKKRLSVDVAYFNKYYYNQQKRVAISSASGFDSTYINTGETTVRKGVEVSLSGSIIKQKGFEWISAVNWSTQHVYYKDLDPVYSPKKPWVQPGARNDIYTDNYWLRDGSGNIIHNNGMPVLSNYEQVFGYTDPKFSFGFINTFIFGNFTAGINIDGRVGGVMYNYIYDKMWDSGTNPESDNEFRYDEVVNGKKNYVGNGVKVISGEVAFDNFGNIISDTRQYAPNDKGISYQAYAQSFRGGDRGVQNKTFVKVREVSLGYRFPAAMLAKSGIKNASVSLTAQNLFLFTNFKYSDPDVDNENLNSPSQRMVGLNIRVGF
ncbi:SusC/RagA family TonB-linked outer membrane protein [Chitinophaga solisilvae]|uniref:SusC/RagA family TonB-linked outer membrane protein n=1 Tax=Chitinophaga solisilvae TaxID=1233460 RepID=A0A3S1CR80_9BACT|nr:SusC/RagA family TonB-linked outer membrane protein [Chitinophaga solisilvae]NSL88372.1 SusC/RagA family TonB-linked outer membrane protein [Chitinophaga solisilvae]